MRDYVVEPSAAASEDILVVLQGGDPLAVPDGLLLFGAEFQRDGGDLVLRNDGHPDIRVPDYFRAPEPADLQSPEGGVLAGHVVARLAGPEASGQYAQAGAPGPGGTPIGQVETVAGPASVQRTDGTTEALTETTLIYMDDVVQTGTGGRLSITFSDGTIFSLFPGSRMVIDELIYTAGGEDNSATFNLVQGGFVFIAGQIAPTGGMEITTPAATMGIRGTTVLVDIQTQNAVTTAEVTLTRDPDGDLGRVALFDLTGNLIATVTGTDTKWIVSSDGEAREVPRSTADEQADNVLIAEATAAYQTAFQRVGQGGTFVELDRTQRGGTPQQGQDGNPDGVDLDSEDQELAPEIEPEQPPESPTDRDGFDEGRNNLREDDPLERDIVVTGLEDAEDNPIAGDLPRRDGGMDTFVIVEPPANGTVTLTADGGYTYVPNPNFFGADRFTYTATNADGTIDEGIVTVNILPVNDTPVLPDTTFAAVEDTVLTGQAIATDVEDGVLIYRLADGADHGDVVVTRDGVWAYTPDPDYAGSDSFRIEVTDADGASTSQTVTVSVAGINDAPVVTSGPQAATGAVTETDAPSAAGLLTADDVDAGATLAWTGSAEGTYGSFSIDPDGSWFYTAGDAAEALGAGQAVTETFTATVTDNEGATATETVRITVTGSNDGPVVTGGTASGAVTENTAPTASGTLAARDADAGATLTWSGSSEGAYGSFAITAEGDWTYTTGTSAETLAEGQTVTETFTATVTDDQGATATEVVTVTLTGSNDAPVVTSGNRAASGSVTENLAPTATGKLSASDADASAGLSWSGSADGTYGDFAITEGGRWTYTADSAAEGLAEGQTVTERFTTTVTDDQGATATQIVTVTLTGTNDAPVITSGNSAASGAVTENTVPTATGKLSASDADAGASLSWSGSADGTYGDFDISDDGTWTYTVGPSAEALTEGQTVTERFTATVTDDQGATATQIVTVTLTGTNDAPVVTSGNGAASGAVTENTAPTATGKLSASDTDAGANLSWSGSADGSYGTFDITDDGKWTYTIDKGAEVLSEGQTVTERFTATVTDDQGETATRIVTVTVTGTNDAPVAVSADFGTLENESVTGALAASDADTGAALNFATATGPAHGTLTVQPDGTFVYTPDSGFAGLDRFTFTATDEAGASSTGTVTVAVNSQPFAHGGGQSVTLDIYPGTEGGEAGRIVATASDISPEGVNLVITMDRSGSIGSADWRAQTEAVADALDALRVQFADSLTEVDVHVITYASTAQSEGTYDLNDPALTTMVRALPYSGGGTNWAGALELAEGFFDAQPAGETNFLYFVTDGAASNSNWRPVLDRLTDEETKGYAVDVEAFGIGGSVNLGTLSEFDDTPQLLDDPSALTGAFSETPLFSAELVELSVTLIADGVDLGEIADETSAGIVTDGFRTTLLLADIDGIAGLLGSENRISVTAGFNLDGDPVTTEVMLFTSEVLGKSDAAESLVGTSGNDLLLGSDEDDMLSGQGGDDILLGYGGDDTLTPGGGADTVLAGAGDDRIVIGSVAGIDGPAREAIDGGTGWDTLAFDRGGDVTEDYLSLIDLSGIEAIDLENGRVNTLELTISDLFDLSGEADTELEALLGMALPESATIYGDSGDNLTLVANPGGSFAATGDQVTGASGTVLDIFRYSEGSDVLQTLAVDADISVTIQAAV